MKTRAYQVPRLSFFPEPLPDETIYSLVNRFHLRSGLLSSRSSLRLLFGTYEIAVGAEFPSILPQISQATKMTVNQLICEHTTIPYYQRFIGNQQYEHFLSSIARGDNVQAVAQLSMVANRIQPEIMLKSCPSCVAEDQVAFGVAYWHRQHQLPGVNYCTRHALVLNATQQLKSTLSSPIIDGSMKKADQGSKAFQYSVLADRCLEYAGPAFDKKRLYAVYYARLHELKLLTPRDQIRMKHFKQGILNYWGQTFSFKPFKQINPVLTQYRYPETLFHKPGANHHPVKHLVLIGFLFERWETFLSYYESGSKNLIKQVPINTQENQLEERKQLAIKLLRSGEKFRNIASKCGLSLSTVSCLAAKEQIAVRPSNRQISPEKRRIIWLKLMIGVHAKDIAVNHGVSRSLVGSILTAQPQLKTLRKRITDYQTRNTNRSTIENIVKSQPSARRVDIQRAANSAYVWLYRHDRTWLFDTLPTEVPRSLRYQR